MSVMDFKAINSPVVKITEQPFLRSTDTKSEVPKGDRDEEIESPDQPPISTLNSDTKINFSLLQFRV